MRTMAAVPRLEPLSHAVGVYGAVSAVLVLVTATYGLVPAFELKNRLIGTFHLGFERNLGAWWSGIAILGGALLAYELSGSAERRTRPAWAVLACICGGLAIDEIGSIHERLPGGWAGLLGPGLALATAVAYVVLRLWREPATRRSARCIVVAFALYGSVAVQEYFEFAWTWPDWLGQPRTALEEATELAGSLLLLLATASQRSAHGATGPGMLVVDPRRLRGLRFVLLAGLAAHLAALLWIVPAIDDHRGDPASVFPVICYFLLFAFALWRSMSPSGTRTRSRMWLVLALAFFGCSAAAMCNLYRLLPGITHVLPPAVLYDPWALVAALTALLLLVGGRELLGALSWKRAAWALCVAVPYLLLLGGSADVAHAVFAFVLAAMLL